MPVHRLRIVVAEAYSEKALSRLREFGDVVLLTSNDRRQLLLEVAFAEALLVRTYTRVDAELIQAAPRLRVIGRGGVGLDNIDQAAAAARGIKVVHTPAASTQAVAEMTIGLMLALERHIAKGPQAVVEGRFHEARERFIGRELKDLTLGIIGMGRIGKTVAQMAHHGFGMRIIYNDIVELGWLDFVSEADNKTHLLESADIVTLHVPLTESTRHLIDATAIARMKPTATLINTCRGPVVDSVALADALNRNRIAGAALDVFDPEPLPADHPLMKCDHALLTPHLASRTHEGIRRMNDVVEDVIRELHAKNLLIVGDLR